MTQQPEPFDDSSLHENLAQRHELLRRDIQAAINELDTGKGESWDIDELKEQLAREMGGKRR